MERLSQADLIVKNVDGSFHLTPYGEQVLTLVPILDFLSKHRDYFLTHILSAIPYHSRIGLAALQDCNLINDVMVTFHNIEEIIKKSKEYVWIMSDQILVSTLPFLSKAIERKVGFRLILPQDISPPESIRQLEDNPVFEQGARKGLLQSRFIEKVDVFICMSEKEVAALSFTNPDGKLDYIGFKANDERAYKWVKNLYSYYWSITSTKIPNKLLTDQKRRH